MERMQNLKLKDKNDIKIFILYLMENLSLPLQFGELNDIAVTDGVVGCIEFAECFAELLDTGNIRPVPQQEAPNGIELSASTEDLPTGTPDPATFFEITPRGRHAATTLQSKLLHYIRDRSLKSALRRLRFGREGGGIRTERSPREDGRYDVTCIARDGAGNETLRVSVIADSAERAEKIRDTFNERPEHIYRAIFALLSGEVNFLFDL